MNPFFFSNVEPEHLAPLLVLFFGIALLFVVGNCVVKLVEVVERRRKK